jgi:hypothetical protein
LQVPDEGLDVGFPPGYGSGSGGGSGVPAIKPPEVPDREFLLKRLEAAGFISEVGGARLDYEGGAYTETETYRKIVGALAAVGD